MSSASDSPPIKDDAKTQRPFRRALLRGAGIVMPPLLTIVLFLWAWHIIESNVLVPIESAVRILIVRAITDEREGFPDDIQKGNIVVETADGVETSLSSLEDQTGGRYTTIAEENSATIIRYNYEGEKYVPLDERLDIHTKWIPQHVHKAVTKNPGDEQPRTVKAYFNRYVDITYLKRQYIVPIFLCTFIMFLYLVGKFVAAGAGRIFWNMIEAIIQRLPIIRAVYSAVKQVTDFAFKEREISYTRIVAVQYPRKGAWSLGFVTGESFLDIRSAVNEPVLSVLMPTSPMPATGFVITVPKSETIDLNITVDQAIQFCVSCGVVVPPHQQHGNKEIAATIEAAIGNGDGRDDNGDETPALAGPVADDSDGDK